MCCVTLGKSLNIFYFFKFFFIESLLSLGFITYKIEFIILNLWEFTVHVKRDNELKIPCQRLSVILVAHIPSASALPGMILLFVLLLLGTKVSSISLNPIR